MRVDVIPIRVGGHYNLKAGKLLRQLQGNLMCHLRCDRVVGMEGLHHVIVHSSVGAMVLLLSVHELPQGNRRNTVYTGHQRPALVIYLCCLAAVFENITQTTYGLGAPVLYEVNDCHPVTALP